MTIRKLDFSPKCYLRGGTLSVADFFQNVFDQTAPAASLRHFHAGIRNLLEVKSAFLYASGRSALMEIVKALSICPGDEVILPGYTCVVIPAALIRLGIIPVYADIDPDTWNIDIRDVESKIGCRTRAVLAQHTFGIPCEIDRLSELAKRKSIHLIEDCAHALGAKVKNIYCGNFGSAAFFSTEQSKMISTVKGGIAVSNAPQVIKKLEESFDLLPYDSEAWIRAATLRWKRDCFVTHGRLGDTLNRILGKLERISGIGARLSTAWTFDAAEYATAIDGEVRLPTRLPGELAALGVYQLRRLENDIQFRNFIAKRLSDLTTKLGWKSPAINWGSTRPSFVRFPALVDDREYWVQRLRENGVEAGSWLNHPIHPIGSNFVRCGYRIGMCPVAEGIAERVINLPIHPRCANRVLEVVSSLSS